MEAARSSTSAGEVEAAARAVGGGRRAAVGGERQPAELLEGERQAVACKL